MHITNYFLEDCFFFSFQKRLNYSNARHEEVCRRLYLDHLVNIHIECKSEGLF